MYFADYYRAYRRVYKELKIQQKFNNEFLIPYLSELEVKYAGSFSAEQKQKIIRYYGLFITSFLCSSYKHLQGETLNEDERKRATLFGILTPVGDDLFDVDKLSAEEIRCITFKPAQYNAKTFSAKVAREIQSFLLETVPDINAYIKASANVLNIQVETIKQTHPDISREEMERITWTKGAVSVIIYHQCLDKAADKDLQEALFLIGSLYQLGNDIFDLYKDVRDNIYTLVNTCPDFKQFKREFLARVKLQNKTIHALPFPLKRKEAFSIVMNTINARSLAAIDQLIRIEKKSGSPVNWWKLERKEMIVDMEKPRNILRWLYYIWKLPKLR